MGESWTVELRSQMLGPDFLTDAKSRQWQVGWVRGPGVGTVLSRVQGQLLHLRSIFLMTDRQTQVLNPNSRFSWAQKAPTGDLPLWASVRVKWDHLWKVPEGTSNLIAILLGTYLASDLDGKRKVISSRSLFQACFPFYWAQELTTLCWETFEDQELI